MMIPTFDMILPITCTTCGTTTDVPVQRADYEAWKAKRVLVQNAFPYLQAGMRELLMSRTCNTCFTTMFGEDDS